MADSSEFNIEVTSADDGAHAVVAVSGEIDMSNAREITAIVDVVAGWAGVSRVDVDLAAVTFIDSSGINALVACHRALQDSQIEFGVVGASGAPRRVLEIIGMLDILCPEPRSASAGEG